MKKQEYFKMIRKINRALRAQGVRWFHTYSEPRKKTSYRTKLYYINYDSSSKIFDSLAAAELVEEMSNGLLEAKRFVGKTHYGHSVLNLVIRPVNLLNQ
jgi:hypothetical protein